MLAIAWVLIGCDKIGQTPPGGSDEEVKAFFDKQPLDVRAKEIMSSPATMEFKANRIKEMYKKEGKEVPPGILPEDRGVGSGDKYKADSKAAK